MWTDASADLPRCVASGEQATAAEPLADGWPHGRALCRHCLRFIPLSEGRLVEHEISSDADDDEQPRRSQWFNDHGW